MNDEVPTPAQRLGETFRAVWEVLAGKRNRSLSFTSLVIKTAK